jgi:hypothetical protein
MSDMPYVNIPSEGGPERDLQNALNKLRAELNEAVGQRDLWNMKIMRLEQNIKNVHATLTQTRLTNFRSQMDQTIVGLTEAIRTVMRAAGRAMTAQEIRLSLSVAGFDVDRFKNPSAAISNTLIRMQRAGELGYDASNKTYQLPPPGYLPMNTPANR